MDRPVGALATLFSRKWSDLTRRAMRLVLETELLTDRLTSAVRVTEDVYYAQVYNGALKLSAPSTGSATWTRSSGR
jgi:hypothetical protein